MPNFEERYKKFKLDNKLSKHLQKLSSQRFPFNESTIEIPTKTIWSDNGDQRKIKKGVTHAKLV